MRWTRVGGLMAALAAVTAAMAWVSPVSAGISARPQAETQDADRAEHGCECDRRQKRRSCEEAWQVPAIFVGRVIQVTPGMPPEFDAAKERASSHPSTPPARKVQFEVDEVLRGAQVLGAAANPRPLDAARQVDVYTHDGAACGYDFTVGESYLIYAQQFSAPSDRGRSLVTSRCSRTRSLAEADEDLAYLRSLTSSSDMHPSGTFHGTVVVLREDYSRIDLDRATSFSPAGIPVVLTQDARTWRTVSDQDGAFVFTGLPGGEFSVQAELTGTPFVMEDSSPFSLPDARACRDVGVLLSDSGRLSARVLTSGHKPVRGLEIHLMGAGEDGVLARTGKSETSDADGGVTFTALPPGRYVLGVGMDYAMVGPVTRRTPLLAASYVEATRQREQRAPGLADLTRTSSVPTASASTHNPTPSSTTSVQVGSGGSSNGAGANAETDGLVRVMPGEFVATLGPGERVIAGDLIVPDTITIVPITGRVVTPAGQPVPNVEVSLILGRDEDDESHPLARESVRTDADGRFQLQGALGWRYWVAESYVVGSTRVTQVAPGETFLTTRDLPPVTVTVTIDPR